MKPNVIKEYRYKEICYIVFKIKFKFPKKIYKIEIVRFE